MEKHGLFQHFEFFLDKDSHGLYTKIAFPVKRYFEPQVPTKANQNLPRKASQNLCQSKPKNHEKERMQR
jgi:hypothetical protein